MRTIPADGGPSASVDDSPLSAGARLAKAAPNSASEGESIPTSMFSLEPLQAKINNLQAALERFDAALHHHPIAVGQNTSNGQASTVGLAAAISTMQATQSQMAATLAAHTAAIAALVDNSKSTHKVEALASLINPEAQGPDILSPQTQREAILMLEVDTLKLCLERERVNHEQTRKAANKPRPRVQARDYPPTGRSTPSTEASQHVPPSDDPQGPTSLETPESRMDMALGNLSNLTALLAQVVAAIANVVADGYKDKGSSGSYRNNPVFITKFQGEEQEEVDAFLFQVDRALADEPAIKGADAKIRFARAHLDQQARTPSLHPCYALGANPPGQGGQGGGCGDQPLGCHP